MQLLKSRVSSLDRRTVSPGVVNAASLRRALERLSASRVNWSFDQIKCLQMLSGRKLAFSTSPAQSWINVTLGMPRRGWRRRVERRQFAGVRRAASLSDPHNENPRSTFRQGCRAIKVGRGAGRGGGVLPPEDFAAGDRGAYGRVQTHGAHGGGRLTYAVERIRSARARASSTHGSANCRVGSRPKAADRSASNALRGSCSIRSARKATPACSIFPGRAYWLES